MADVLALPDQQCQLVTWIMRQGEVEIDAIASYLEVDAGEARTIVAELARSGFVAEVDRAGLTVVARIADTRKRRTPASIWDALDCAPGGRDDT